MAVRRPGRRRAREFQEDAQLGRDARCGYGVDPGVRSRWHTGSRNSERRLPDEGGGVEVSPLDQLIGQLGQTLQGTQQAQVTQTSTNGANSVQLNQAIGQLAATLNQNVSQSVNSDQTFSISQTSLTGAQSIKVNQVSAQLET